MAAGPGPTTVVLKGGPSDPWPRRALLALLIGFVLAFTALAQYRFAYYWTTSYDLTIYWHALHQFTKGTTWVSCSWSSFLGLHAHWVHWLLAPLAWTGSPLGLFFLQALSVAAAGAALFRYAARRLDGWSAHGLAAAWLLGPLVQFPVLFDYHPEVLGVGALAWALVALDEGRTRTALALLLWVAATKETSGVVVAALAPWIAVRLGRPRLAAGVFALGLVAFLGGQAVIGAWNENGFSSASLYGPLGTTLPGVAWHIVRHPFATAAHLASADRLETVLLLLGSGLFLPLLRPWHLLAVSPLVLAVLLTDLENMHSVRYHYFALPLVAVGFATADALGEVASLKARAQVVSGILIATAMGLHLMLSPVLELPLWRHHEAEVARREALDEVLRAIPPGVPVAAPLELTPHLSDRPAVYLVGFLRHGYPLAKRFPVPPELGWVVIEPPPDAREAQGWTAWLATEGTWERVLAGREAWVFRRVPA